MQAAFAPAIALMSRLRYPGKFAVTGVLAFIAIGVLLASLANSLFSRIADTRHELAATRLIRPLQKQIQLTQQHRGLSAGFLSGNAAMKPKLDAKQAEVTQAAAAVGAAVRDDAAVLGGMDEWQGIAADWDQLRAGLAGMTPPQSFAAHTKLIERLLHFQSSVADAGSLTGDPEIATFYLIDTMVVRLPDMLERLGRMRAKGTAVLTRHEVTEADRIELSVHLAILARNQERVRDNLEKVARQNPAIAAEVRKLAADLSGAAAGVVAIINDDMLGGRFGIAPQAYFDRATETIDIGYREIYDGLLPTLDNELNARIAKLETELALQTGLAAILLLLLGYVSIGAYYAIMAEIHELSGGAAAIAQGDLSVRVSLLGRDELTAVSASFNAMADSVGDLLSKSQRTSDNLTSAAAGLTRSAHDVADSSREQSDAAAGMAASIEQMTVSIDQIAEHAKTAQETSAAAGGMSQEGGRVVDATVGEIEQIAAAVTESARLIEDLGRRSNEISAIVNVIKEIADQTNLLALNAAIEAARAGDLGRGFAVVADEVRKLAERTTAATTEIGSMIEAMQGGTAAAVESMQRGVQRVESGVSLSRQAGDAIARIRDSFDKVLDSVREINAALKEQSAANAGVAQSVERIARMAEANSESVSAMADTARRLEGMAGEVQAEVRRFRVAR
ncbi:MAG TPA: methyl-accepting chemotaxis protein [Rhodocyclaceae bacterium]